MISENLENPLIEEKKLVGTMITGKPSRNAFIVATYTILFTAMMSLIYWLSPTKIADIFPAINFEIFKNLQLWRLFTATFVHSDLQHFLSNAYMLWIFSFFVFGYFGLGVFPTASIFLAAVVNLVSVATYAPHVELVGASGLVYILGGFWLTLYFLIQRQYKILNRLMRVMGISLMIFWPSTFAPTTSYRAHAIGFLLGTLLGIFYFYKNRKMIRDKEIYQVSYV